MAITTTPKARMYQRLLPTSSCSCGRGQLLAAGSTGLGTACLRRSRVPTMSSLATVAVAISAPLEVDMMAASAAATTRPAMPCGSTSVTIAG